MFENFIASWLAQRDPHGGAMPLWVYGQSAMLDAFLADISNPSMAAMIAITSQSIEDGLAALSSDPALGEMPIAYWSSISLRDELQAAPLLVIRIDSTDQDKLSMVDQVVDNRYAACLPTVVLSIVDPCTAYKSIPRIVGRILENGDSVEVADDGAHCAEFIFDPSAASDYRIQVLRKRVGRVAIVR